MAYDKVVDSAQLEAAITASANAIREKTGDTALIQWLGDKGFADAIAAIGGTDDIFARFIEGHLTELNSTARYVDNYRFTNYLALEAVNLPYATAIDMYAFSSCENLKTVDIPYAEGVGEGAFSSCTALYLVDCSSLTILFNTVFFKTNLRALVIRNTSNVADLLNTNAFEDTPISNGYGYIYVPRSMIDAYTTANNWGDYADQFRALEDYTVDGTINGELDVEFGVGKIEFTTWTWDFDAGMVGEMRDGMFADPEMQWGDWIDNENNTLWSRDEWGHIISADGEYYVFNPFANDLVFEFEPIGYLFNDIGEPIIVVITAEEAQDYM